MNTYIWKKIADLENSGKEFNNHSIELIVKDATRIDGIIHHCIDFHTNKWCWITIRPDDETDDLEFIHKVFKWMNAKFITKYMYVFEQTGIETIEGIHSHILLKHTNRVDSVFRSIKDKFKCYSYLKSCPPEYIDDKIGYMTGDKGGDKSAKQKIDKFMRNKYGLKQYYTNIELE